MIQKIKALVLSLSLLFAPMTAIAVVGVASAQTPNIQGNLCQGAQQLQINPDGSASCETPQGTTDNLNNLIRRVINILSVIIGVIAVIMIIFGGFKYITSGGSPEKVTGAKNTILYALIGLIIVALAQIIVRFVLSSTSGINNP